MLSSRNRRLRTALVFSAVCLVVVFAGSKAFDVRLAPDDSGRALAMMVPALGLALASVWAGLQLVAALLDCRPALSDRAGRWLWLWTLVYSAALVALGLASSASQTIGQIVLYASGLLVGVIGSIGLLISAMPRWNRRASGR